MQQHMTRASALFTVLTIALYITGLQDKVVEPIVELVGPLGLIVAGVCGVWGFIAWRLNRQRNELRQAKAAVGSHLPR